MIDLHTHSTASDGSLTPAGLVEKAALAGLNTLALTDHDTLAGLEEAEKAARNQGISFIPGVELEIQTPGSFSSPPAGEFHLLGLGITMPTAEFLDTLRYLAETRERRNHKMVEKMKEAGIEVHYDDIRAFAGGAGLSPASRVSPLVGRPHFGAFLVSRRLAKNQEQAFRRWLGRGRPFYVPREGLDFEKAVRLIHESGGAAVLAHPMSLYVSWGRLPAFLETLKEKGLDGLEAWHPTAGVKDCKRLEETGRNLELCITAGSDFHGSARPDRRLGYTSGNRKIEDRFMEELKANIRP
ncbi:MAG: PHP domain-containing protein [Treponema sp.]|jgi:predicted metal-dependent phosphoesterase TrpH|nr:PHP domain-containing protein [Treponema sp.]